MVAATVMKTLDDGTRHMVAGRDCVAPREAGMVCMTAGPSPSAPLTEIVESRMVIALAQETGSLATNVTCDRQRGAAAARACAAHVPPSAYFTTSFARPTTLAGLPVRSLPVTTIR